MSKNVRAGGAYIELGLRAKLDKGLQKAAKKLRSFGGTALRIGGGVAGGAAAAVTPLLIAAATAQEVGSKFETVFGDSTEQVRKWGDEFAGQVGRSRVQVAQFLSSSQDLFVPLGFDAKSAEGMSKTVTGLAVDLASFNNKADADVMNDLQAALTGSGEVMKKYGVILSEAAVKQELMNQGIDPKSATNAQKVQARLNIIMRGTTAAQGDALRTAGSFTNQMKALTASGSNLAVTLGQHLLPPATKLLQFFNRGIGFVMRFAEQNRELARKLVLLVAGGGLVGAVLATVGTVLMGIGFAIPAIITGLGLVTSAFAALISPVAIAIAVMAGVAYLAYSNREALMKFAMSIWDMVEPVRTAFGEIFQVVKDSLGGMFSALVSGNISLAGDILWATLKVAFLSGVGKVQTIWANFTLGMKEVWSTMTHGISSGFRSAVGVIFSIVETVAGKVKGILESVSEYDPTGLTGKLASGLGTVTTLANIAQQGIEIKQQKADQARAREQARRGQENLDRIEAIGKKATDAAAKRDALIKKANEGADGVTLTSLKDGFLAKFRDKFDAAAKEGKQIDPSSIASSIDEAQAKAGKLSKTRTAGTFSAVGAQLLGLGGQSGPASETAKNTRKMTFYLEKIARQKQERAERALKYS